MLWSSGSLTGGEITRQILDFPRDRIPPFIPPLRLPTDPFCPASRPSRPVPLGLHRLVRIRLAVQVGKVVFPRLGVGVGVGIGIATGSVRI